MRRAPSTSRSRGKPAARPWYVSTSILRTTRTSLLLVPEVLDRPSQAFVELYLRRHAEDIAHALDIRDTPRDVLVAGAVHGLRRDGHDGRCRARDADDALGECPDRHLGVAADVEHAAHGLGHEPGRDRGRDRVGLVREAPRLAAVAD